VTAETAAVSTGALDAALAAVTRHLAEDEQRLAAQASTRDVSRLSCCAA
jgi:hypothetical protein